MVRVFYSTKEEIEEMYIFIWKCMYQIIYRYIQYLEFLYFLIFYIVVEYSWITVVVYELYKLFIGIIIST